MMQFRDEPHSQFSTNLNSMVKFILGLPIWTCDGNHMLKQ